ncbi:MAG: hypothetical protein KJ893_00480 [Candidatus Omnitrophica bacterium]|nr:hypothetical protein [Candidatus Omnitrophota bacterium]MBU4479326.1 hypothetical protein [Candidatus Omnitrophota bacterium]MCG2704234.1 hypothetical protein [Candidatus Omnitrophota bacterium]
MVTKIAFIAAIVLPLWNIPLIVRIVRRKSSQDISLLWAFGVWGCLLLMFPAALKSTDIVWKAFNISNLILFSAVVFTAVLFRSRKK